MDTEELLFIPIVVSLCRALSIVGPLLSIQFRRQLNPADFIVGYATVFENSNIVSALQRTFTHCGLFL